MLNTIFLRFLKKNEIEIVKLSLNFQKPLAKKLKIYYDISMCIYARPRDEEFIYFWRFL